MRVAVAGASGYVGSRLVPRLAQSGHQVMAMSRSADRSGETSTVEHRRVDIADEARLTDALAGIDAAVYLVHSMSGDGGFVERDRDLASTFARAAADAGVKRIVYLGGLGDEDAESPHLASRHEVGAVLAGAAGGGDPGQREHLF